ncbi:DUF2599 domain-containing protein [Pseudomonas farris]|uniref:DUF2599 domain-containing protein n=1 Tax=Pseudomonas farris TaxID=2841207 RepID=UPI003462B834
MRNGFIGTIGGRSLLRPRLVRDGHYRKGPRLWDELTRDYSNSRYWKNTHGMRHQLICHLAIARDKPQWNLEPWRPDVGYAKTLEAGCNHVVPLPEKAP